MTLEGVVWAAFAIVRQILLQAKQRDAADTLQALHAVIDLVTKAQLGDTTADVAAEGLARLRSHLAANDSSADAIVADREKGSG